MANKVFWKKLNDENLFIYRGDNHEGDCHEFHQHWVKIHADLHKPNDETKCETKGELDFET